MATMTTQTATFQSTSSVWRTTSLRVGKRFLQGISIHVLRVEDDCRFSQKTLLFVISIHVLRVEDDLLLDPVLHFGDPFQSTSSVWRTTLFSVSQGEGIPISIHVLRVEDDFPSVSVNASCRVFQSTSSVWRTTDPTVGYFGNQELISIHVLRVEDDSSTFTRIMGATLFQSTSSVWRTTKLASVVHGNRLISIHVLRVEDDFSLQASDGCSIVFQSTSSVWRTTVWRRRRGGLCLYFNPRPPCGGRPASFGGHKPHIRFQSTSSVWRTTYLAPYIPAEYIISIHVLRVEDDQTRFRCPW